MKSRLSFDPPHTRVVLIGASEFPKDLEQLKPLPAVRNNVLDLQKIFTDIRIIGIPPQHIRQILDPQTPTEVLEGLAEEAGAATDTLIVYYAGHGLIGPRANEFYLTTSGTTWKQVEQNGLPFAKVRDELRHAAAKKRVLFLDCCFSGRAIADVATNQGALLQANIEIEGAYVLTSVPSNELAAAPSGERYTAFSGALITILRTGIDHQQPTITLRDLHDELVRFCQVHHLPRPQQANRQTVDQFALAYNCYGRQHPTSDPVDASEGTPAFTQEDWHNTADEVCLHCLRLKEAVALCPHCQRSGDPIARQPSDLPPRTILNFRYVVGTSLAHGGFGMTYLGFDLKLARKIAIKEYFPRDWACRGPDGRSVIPESGESVEYFKHGLKQFIQEAQRVAQFSGRADIVNVHDVFPEFQTGYMVMDYVEGETLAAVVQRHQKRLPGDEAVRILLAVLEALNVVHAKGLFHQDISPQNIMLTPTGHPVLIDFGAARDAVSEYTQSLAFVKPGYSPLEQYGHGPIGPYTDIYACGATFYRMMTGEVPPSAPDRLQKDRLRPLPAFAHLKEVSSALNAVILKALSVDIPDRFQEVADFKHALEVVLEGADEQEVTEIIMPVRPPVRRQGVWVVVTLLWAATAVLLLVAILAWFGLIHISRPILSPAPISTVVLAPVLTPVQAAPTTDLTAAVYDWVLIAHDKAAATYRELCTLSVKQQAATVAKNVDSAKYADFQRQIREIEANITIWLDEYGQGLQKLCKFPKIEQQEAFKQYHAAYPSTAPNIPQLTDVVEQHAGAYCRSLLVEPERWRQDLAALRCR